MSRELQRTVDETNAALRRLSSATNTQDAESAARELNERHLPALEHEDEVIGKAAKATMRWMLREIALAKKFTVSATL